MKGNEQQEFWKSQFGEQYRDKNTKFDEKRCDEAWSIMLRYFNGQLPQSILECGSNIGRNLKSLKSIAPSSELSLIELNKESFDIAVKRFSPKQKFNGSIDQAPFENDSFDLVFTSGVLIHIHPNDLLPTMKKMFDLSDRYILLAEYFSREPESIIYHGQKDKLFKMDFGKYFLNNFDVKILDYGFLWGHIYDDAGFDDMTWWLFEKI